MSFSENWQVQTNSSQVIKTWEMNIKIFLFQHEENSYKKEILGK